MFASIKKFFIHSFMICNSHLIWSSSWFRVTYSEQMFLALCISPTTNQSLRLSNWSVENCKYFPVLVGFLWTDVHSFSIILRNQNMEKWKFSSSKATLINFKQFMWSWKLVISSKLCSQYRKCHEYIATTLLTGHFYGNWFKLIHKYIAQYRAQYTTNSQSPVLFIEWVSKLEIIRLYIHST